MIIEFKESRFFTLITSFVSILGSFTLFSLLSYNMSEIEFNNFAVEIRYAGFIAGLASMHLGYSLISHSKEYFFSKVFPSIFWSVFIISVLYGGVFSFLYSDSIGIVFWIIATAIFHIFINSIRVQSNGEANIISIFIKFFVLIIIGWISLYSFFLNFYAIYGLVTIVIMITILISRGFSLLYFSLSDAKKVIKHTTSRMIDEIIRLSFYLIPI